MNSFKNFQLKPKRVVPEPVPVASCDHAHYHKDEDGVLVKCYHVCKRQFLGIKQVLCSPAFWMGLTISYPFEHILYEEVPGFSHFNEWLHAIVHQMFH